jgi:hypothetical protein
MRPRSRSVLAVIAAVCVGAGALLAVTRQDGTAVQTPTGSNMDVSIDWRMAVIDGGKKLRIEYTATNESDERLWLCDQLLTHENNELVYAADRVIVLNGDEPGQVLFARGRVDRHIPSAFPRNPGGRAFDPGQALTGTAEIALPLQAWHNYGHAAPLEGTPKTAVLELSYVKGEASWGQVTLRDGTTIVGPQPPAHLLNARGEEKPIPQG